MDAALPTKRAGKKFTPQEIKAAKNFFNLMEDCLKMRMMLSLCKDPKTRKKWDKKFAKRDHFVKLVELPEEGQEFWRMHLFITKQYALWKEIVTDPRYHNQEEQQDGENQADVCEQEGEPGS